MQSKRGKNGIEKETRPVVVQTRWTFFCFKDCTGEQLGMIKVQQGILETSRCELITGNSWNTEQGMEQRERPACSSSSKDLGELYEVGKRK